MGVSGAEPAVEPLSHPMTEEKNLDKLVSFLASVETCGGPGSPRSSVSHALELTRVQRTKRSTQMGRKFHAVRIQNMSSS